MALVLVSHYSLLEGRSLRRLIRAKEAHHGSAIGAVNPQGSSIVVRKSSRTFLDRPALTTEYSYWILFPISIVMILTGVLRHYATVLLQTTPKKLDLPAQREQLSLRRGINLRNNASAISPSAFAARKNYMISAYKEGSFLKDPDSRGKAAPNPMTDPAAMEGMMGMMKGNMAMMVPQTLIMGWINAFFAGYVISTPAAFETTFDSMLEC